jgi:hypothetical protein
MGGILDDFETVTPGKGQHLCHIARQAAEMDGHYRFAVRRQATFGVIEVDRECTFFDIDQYNFGAEVANHGARGRECQCGHDHFVAWPDSTRLSGEVQTRRCRIHRHGLNAAAEKLREFELEFSRLGSGGEPAGPHHGDHRLDLLPTDNRAKAWYSVVV